MFRLSMFVLMLLADQSLSIDPESTIEAPFVVNADSTSIPPEIPIFDDVKTISIELPNVTTEIPQFEELTVQDLPTQLNETETIPEVELRNNEKETADKGIEILKASFDRIIDFLTMEFGVLNSFHKWQVHEEHVLPELEFESNDKENHEKETQMLNDSFVRIRDMVTKEFEILKPIYVSKIHETEITPEAEHGSNENDSSDKGTELLNESFLKITDFVTKEFELLKSIYKPEQHLRLKREALDELNKYIYFIGPLDNDIKGEKSEFVSDDLPDIETNETENVERVAEPAKKIDETATVVKTEDNTRKLEQTPIPQEPKNAQETFQPEILEYVEEVTQNIETEVVEEPGQPKYMHISKSSIHRLSQTVPHYLPQQMQYYLF